MKESETSVCPHCEESYNINTVMVGKIKKFTHLKINLSVKFSLIFSCPHCHKTLGFSTVK